MLPRNALLTRQLIFTISAGFGLSLALIVALTLVGLRQLTDANARLEAIVDENSVKSRLANQMRDILRDRAISMHSIVVMNDLFDRDQEMLRFYGHGSAYQQVRLQLGPLIRLPEERAVLADIDRLTRTNQPVMVRIVDLAQGGFSFLAFEALQNEAIPLQRRLVTELDKLIQIQRHMTAQAVTQARTAFDRTRWLMIALGVTALMVGAFVAGAVVHRTVRLAAETERERTKYQTLFETNSDGIVILDRDGFTDCNPATLKMFRMASVAQFLKCRPEELGIDAQPCGTPPAQLARHHLDAAMDTGHASFQWLARRPDGSTFPAEIALHAMELDGQTVLQAIMRDISARQAAEAELRAARDTALAATEMKSQFVANVSHEIRTPMNGILGMNRLLLDSPLNARQRECAEAIDRSAQALLRVINDLLDFSKIEAGHLTVEEIEFDLDQLLQDVLALYLPRAEAKGLTLRLERHPALPAWVRGDPLRMRQILLNLLDNAIKFTPRGEVCLTAEPLAAGALRFAVSDTGIGMAPEVQARIFQAFAQGDGSVSRKYGGTGLGLAISRQLAQLMRGGLELDSQAGQGSSFRLTLPLPAADPLARPAPAPSAWRFDGARVLVAEDNPVNQRLTGYMLERLGARPLVVADGKAAYERLGEQAVDLVLMDCQMPEWDGLTATRAIRAREAARGLARVPILALSANAMADGAQASRQAGMDDYLVKPLMEADLAEALARWLPDRARPADPAPAAAFQRDKLRRLCGDDPAQMAEMLDLFIASTDTLLDELDRALARRDGAGCARQAHQIKGAAAYLGVEAMTRAAGAAEQCAKREDWDACAAARAELAAAFETARREMAAARSG